MRVTLSGMREWDERTFRTVVVVYALWRRLTWAILSKFGRCGYRSDMHCNVIKQVKWGNSTYAIFNLRNQNGV